MKRVVAICLVWLLLGGVAMAQSSFDDINALPSGDGTAVTDPALEATTTTTATTATQSAQTTTTTTTAESGPEILIVIAVALLVLIGSGRLLLNKRLKL